MKFFKKRRIALRVIPEREMLVNWDEIAEHNSANLAAAVIAGDIKGITPTEADYALAKKHGLI